MVDVLPFHGFVLAPGSDQSLPAEVLERGSAAELRSLVSDGRYVRGPAGFLVHRVTKGERTLTGVVAEVALDDYVRGALKPHEAVRKDLVDELAARRETAAAESTPVLVAHRPIPSVDALVAEVTGAPPLVEVDVADVRQGLWPVPSPRGGDLERGFRELTSLYIIDGHHRVEAACRIAERREAAGSPAGPHDHILAVLVSTRDLHVAPYHRWVRAPGTAGDELLRQLRDRFEVEVVGSGEVRSAPRRRGEFAMHFDGVWYRVRTGGDTVPEGPDALDVIRLQDTILDPLLGIHEPDTDSRLEFVAGPEGIDGLERCCREAGGVAFALHPPDIDEVLAATDVGRVLPPKSTWFGPKPTPGLLLRLLDAG